MSDLVHSFSLILPEGTIHDDELESVVFQATEGDCLLRSSKGVVSVDFDRRAETRQDAIAHAILQMNEAGLHVARVELLTTIPPRPEDPTADLKEPE